MAPWFGSHYNEQSQRAKQSKPWDLWWKIMDMQVKAKVFQLQTTMKLGTVMSSLSDLPFRYFAFISICFFFLFVFYQEIPPRPPHTVLNHSLFIWLFFLLMTNRIMEIIGKGAYELGSVWVALKVPDGYISAHANQVRNRNKWHVSFVSSIQTTLIFKNMTFYRRESPRFPWTIRPHACTPRMWSLLREAWDYILAPTKIFLSLILTIQSHSPEPDFVRHVCGRFSGL